MKKLTTPQRFVCILLIFNVIVFGIGCESKPATTAATDKDTSMATANASMISIDSLSNQKDPSCGMPVSAGISDTAHYNQYVLGFCSSECKAAFKKDPEAMLAAAEIKKGK
ncbi:MAG: YHS domain-containing protein [Sediminibacterium sp.]|nr:YHS domain-containing protein [Sediminibacterium sp.]